MTSPIIKAALAYCDTVPIKLRTGRYRDIAYQAFIAGMSAGLAAKHEKQPPKANLRRRRE